MKEERMAILRMLEKGIISATEAEKLILALQTKGTKERINTEEISDQISDTLSKMGDALGSFMKTIGEKAEDVAKEVEPVVKKMAESVAEKTAAAAEELKKAANKRKEQEPVDADEFQDDFSNTENPFDTNQETEKKDISNLTPDEFKNITFQENISASPLILEKEDEKELLHEEDNTFCEKENACCGRQAEECSRPSPCCWSEEPVDWADEWKMMDEKKKQQDTEKEEEKENL